MKERNEMKPVGMSRQLDLFAQSFPSAEESRADIGFNIEPEVLAGLVEGGIFEMFDLELEEVIRDFLRKLPEFRDAVRDGDEDKEMNLTESYTARFERACDIIQEAMLCARDGNCGGWCSEAGYVEDVYHHYAVNSACNGERSIPYQDFLKCCGKFAPPV